MQLQTAARATWRIKTKSDFASCQISLVLVSHIGLTDMKEELKTLETLAEGRR